MKVTIIGTNGLLSDQMAEYCMAHHYSLSMYGLKAPHYQCHFSPIDLSLQDFSVSDWMDSDVIIYASGAGIQSNLKESGSLIYQLNTFVPITICNSLSQLNYRGIFVTFGSYFEIGANNSTYKFTEQDLIRSVSPVPNDYCVSKRLLTRYVSSSHQTFQHLHLILPTIYGPTESAHRLIPYTLHAIETHQSLQFTSGTQVRQYLYIGDLPLILFSLISHKFHSLVLNVSGRETYTVRQLVELICSYKGYDVADSMFGQTNREDTGMVNLQLDDTLLSTMLPMIQYTSVNEVLSQYH